MKKITLLPFLCFYISAFCQIFSVSHSHNFGTTGDEPFKGAIKFSDGSHIFCSIISDASNDYTGVLYGMQDIWVVKTDINDNIIWQKVFGGSGYDRPADIVVNDLNEVFVVAASNSGADGNKTVERFGGSDIWVIKLDTAGNNIGQFHFGSDQDEDVESNSAAIDDDNNLWIAGTSWGGISGNKSTTNFGIMDVWLFSMDHDGNMRNDISLGGTLFDRNPKIVISENIYLSAQTTSDISGNKTTGFYGGENDVWIIKLDENLNILAQTEFGGTLDDRPADACILNGDYILCLHSTSDISGNKTCPKYGTRDALALKIDTVDLSISNQQSFGGSGSTSVFSAVYVFQNQLLCAGYADGSSNTYKSANTFGGEDIWLLGLDEDLSPLWNTTVGGNDDDGAEFSIFTEPGYLELYTDFSSSSNTGNIGCSNYGEADVIHCILSTDLGLPGYKNTAVVTVFPNPATDVIHVSDEVKSHYFIISDQLGREVLRSTTNDINVISLQKGMYFISGEDFNRSFVKQ